MTSSQDDLTSASDTELVKLAKAGNKQAFDQLFQRYKGPVRGYIVSLVGNGDDTDDLCQWAFFNAWHKILTLHDEDRFKPWIFRIARNLAYDFRRIRARSAAQSLEKLQEQEWFQELNDPDSAVNPEDETVTNELVKLALAELPSHYRDCLVLLIKGTSSRDEIAESLKISKASVSTYIYNARKLFQQAYKRLMDEVDNPGKGDQPK